METSAGQEVTSKIGDSFIQPICNYCVGFLRIERQGNIEGAQPAGTGSLVKLGRVYGVLTAAHVLQPMGKNEVVGLVRFPGFNSCLQNFRLDLGHTDNIANWNGNEGEAPDIAFLKIPEITGRELEAQGAGFYNLGLARKFAPGKPENRMAVCYAVVGVVGEWTETPDTSAGGSRKVIVGGLFGAAKNLKEFREGDVDLVEIEIDYVEGSRIPKSYGGVSGGALWELHVELDEKLATVTVGMRLHGVAFRQSHDHCHITFNSASIIDAIKQQITAKWLNNA